MEFKNKNMYFQCALRGLNYTLWSNLQIFLHTFLPLFSFLIFKFLNYLFTKSVLGLFQIFYALIRF